VVQGQAPVPKGLLLWNVANCCGIASVNARVLPVLHAANSPELIVEDTTGIGFNSSGEEMGRHQQLLGVYWQCPLVPAIEVEALDDRDSSCRHRTSLKERIDLSVADPKGSFVRQLGA
jgi:hypothetical protein